jgi:glycerol-3-phosphate dehydrogenase
MKPQEKAADLLVIGGGINGTAIAREAAGRGLSVVLCEKQDLAEGTSSKSSKLIHGGLRYLEYYEFRLVREALAEREILMRTAPHVVWPQEFVLPHTSQLRPAWMLRTGLLIYDHLGGKRSLPSSRGLDLSHGPKGQPLREELRKGFSYWDCRSDDARIVVLNALAASRSGAEILTRTAFVRATPRDTLWHAQLRCEVTGAEREVTARMIINAAGPWANGVLGGLLEKPVPERVRNIKGSHVVLPKLYEGDHGYLFQTRDGRVLFVLPYEGDYTMIGNTDVGHDAEPGPVEISQAEVDYLCNGVNHYFDKQVHAGDVVWAWSGLRPLYDDGQENVSAITRDYVLKVYREGARPPVLSVFGGKVTTARRLAVSALENVAQVLPGVGPAWSHERALPGGDIPGADFAKFRAKLESSYPGLPAGVVGGYARRYGTRAHELLGSRQSVSELGIDFGGGLYEREVRFLMDEEWARTAEDVLWRRTKLGLKVGKQGIAALESWMSKAAIQTPSQAMTA